MSSKVWEVQWLPFLLEAPDGIREYLLGTFWILVFLLLVWVILKLLFNDDFKKLYTLIGAITKSISRISKSAAKGALQNLELPER